MEVARFKRGQEWRYRLGVVFNPDETIAHEVPGGVRKHLQEAAVKQESVFVEQLAVAMLAEKVE